VTEKMDRYKAPVPGLRFVLLCLALRCYCWWLLTLEIANCCVIADYFRLGAGCGADSRRSAADCARAAKSWFVPVLAAADWIADARSFVIGSDNWITSGWPSRSPVLNSEVVERATRCSESGPDYALTPRLRSLSNILW
jgi:hypothetical protein